MSGELIVQTLKGPTSGANANKIIVPSGHTLDASAGFVPPAGHVVQVVQGTMGYTASGGGDSGNVWYDSGLSVSITPTSASSKILVSYTMHIGVSSYQARSRIVRNSTVVGTGTNEGARGEASSAYILYDDVGFVGQYKHAPLGISYLDNPSTTASLNYKIQVSSYTGHTWYVNRSYTFQSAGDYSYDSIPLSEITLMEIAQ